MFDTDEDENECFTPGDTVIWTPENFNPGFWGRLTEEDRVKYYQRFGYGCTRMELFTFLCYHKPQYGHCVLVNMRTSEVLVMCHPCEFRLATDEEC